MLPNTAAEAINGSNVGKEYRNDNQISTSAGETKGMFGADILETAVGSMEENAPKHRVVRQNPSPNQTPTSLSEANDFESLLKYMDSNIVYS